MPAGKTTLLNALSGRATYARVQGDVSFNGHAATRNDLDFVPQFDELSSTLLKRLALRCAELNFDYL